MTFQWVADHVRKVGLYLTAFLISGLLISTVVGFYIAGVGGSVLGFVGFVGCAFTVWAQWEDILEVALPLVTVLTIFGLIGASIYFLWNVR